MHLSPLPQRFLSTISYQLIQWVIIYYKLLTSKNIKSQSFVLFTLPLCLSLSYMIVAEQVTTFDSKQNFQWHNYGAV